MFKLFFLLALVAVVAVFAAEEKDLTESESHAFGYYRAAPYWTGARYYSGYAGYPYYRSLGFPRYYSGLYL